MYGASTITVLFLTWRVALTFDTVTDPTGGFWSVMEWIIIVNTLAFLFMPYAMLGSWLFDKGHTKRWQTMLGGVVIAFGFGWFMLLADLMDMDEHGAFGIPFINFIVLLSAGGIGGVYAHQEWFRTSKDAA